MFDLMDVSGREVATTTNHEGGHSMNRKRLNRTLRSQRRTRAAPREIAKSKTLAQRATPLLDIIDELDLIDRMLRCVAELLVVLCMIRNEQSGDFTLDPIRQWIETLGCDVTAFGEIGTDHRGDKIDLLNSPDAMVEMASWRLRRLGA